MDRKSSVAPGRDINRVKQGDVGIQLALSVWKNSLAPHEKIEVDMLWYTDYDDRDPAGHFRQKTYFDWHSASTMTLIGLLKDGGQKAKRIYEILDIHLGDERTAWSKTLGISAKDAVSYRQFGEFLEARLAIDSEFRNALYAECGIRRRYLFQPGMDFREQEKIAVALCRSVATGRKQQAQTIAGDTDDDGIDPDDLVIAGDTDDSIKTRDQTIVGDDRRRTADGHELLDVSEPSPGFTGDDVPEADDPTIVEDVDDSGDAVDEEPWDGEEALRIVPTQPAPAQPGDNGQETL
jgi:hypothetical protein